MAFITNDLRKERNCFPAMKHFIVKRTMKVLKIKSTGIKIETVLGVRKASATGTHSKMRLPSWFLRRCT